MPSLGARLELTGLHPYLQHDGPIAMAHRGGGPAKYENTWRAFQTAVDLGYTYLETDVRITADGEVVTFHDATPARVSHRTEAIRDLAYAELAEIPIGGSEQVPLLRDVLARFPRLNLNIDVKEQAAVEPTLAVLNSARAWDRVCLASFSDRRLRLMRQASQQPFCMSSGPLQLAAFKLRSKAPLLRAAENWPFADVLQVPVKQFGLPVLRVGLVTAAHRCDLAVHVWVVNSRPLMEHVLNLGVDGVITDEIDLLKQVLLDRGQWH